MYAGAVFKDALDIKESINRHKYMYLFINMTSLSTVITRVLSCNLGIKGLTARDGEVAPGGGVPALGNSKTNGTEVETQRQYEYQTIIHILKIIALKLYLLNPTYGPFNLTRSANQHCLR